MALAIEAENIWLSTQPVDFRLAIDGLCQLVLEKLSKSPKEGLYIFYNKRRNRLKLLVWHRNGFMLLNKRLEQGRFSFRFGPSMDSSCAIGDKQLQAILLGLNWQMVADWQAFDFDFFG